MWCISRKKVFKALKYVVLHGLRVKPHLDSGIRKTSQNRMFPSFISRFKSPKVNPLFATTLQAEPPPAEMLRLLPRSFDSLEVWLLLFCGLYGLLVSSLILPGAGELKLMCIAFLLLAIAKRVKPARTKNQWFGGAILALLISGAIYLDPNSGGVAGPFLYLMILLAMGYPLLMDNAKAFVYGLTLVSVYYFAATRVNASLPQEVLLLRGVLLAGLCILSARFGAVLRHAEEAMDAMRRDSQSLAYNSYGLHFYGDMLTRRCARNGVTCTMVLLRMPMHWIADVVSPMEPMHQNSVHTLALRDIATNITAIAPQGSLLARTSELDWVLIVPGMNRADAIEHLVANFGRPLQIPYGLKEDEWFVDITPCAVESSDDYPTVPAMLTCAETIWERGFNSGAV